MPGRYFIRYEAAPRYLDVSGDNPNAGTPLQIWQRVGGPNQEWEIIKSPEDGYYYIRSNIRPGVDRYLDVRWGDTAPGTPVHIWDFNGGDAQKWRILDDNGTLVLQSRLGTYLQVESDLNADGVQVVTGPDTAGRTAWRLEPVKVIPGTYYIKTGLASRYLDVYELGSAAGTPLQIWDKVGGPNQKWEIIPVPGEDSFFIKSEMGRYLDVEWGSTAPGTPVHIWDFNGGNAQKWGIETQPDGTVALKSKLGTYLDVVSARTGNGTRVATAQGAAEPSRRWSLEPIVSPEQLHGWADLHTHPMSHLGFGKKLMHGVPDVGSLIPAGTRGCNPTDMRATTIEEALGHCNSTHGGWGTDNGCGDYIRAAILSHGLDTRFVHKTGNVHGDHEHEGYPNLPFWPHQTSVIHQQMWWSWIERAYQGGLRVMVSLAVNNELLGTIINGDPPRDDRASADLQIDEMRAFVGRHSDFMEIAFSAADLRRIVSDGKLAVILGVEVDNLGNFNTSNPSLDDVRAELRRLHNKGVRYVFPIHVVDNKLGGAAVYEDMFNYANKFSTGAPYTIASASDPTITLRMSSADWWMKPILDGVSLIPYPPAFHLFECPFPVIGCWDQFRRINDLLQPDPRTAVYDSIPGGHVNARGLTPLGELAVAEMMRMGMLIDLDHMSERSMVRTIEIAEAISPGGYPLMMGHTGIRTAEEPGSERSVSAAVAARVGRLGGMMGVGSADISPAEFIKSYNRAFEAMGGRVAGIGTDANGLEPLPRATPNLDPGEFYSGFGKSRTGNREWDYTAEGTAHYGLMWDFLRDVERQPGGGAAVVGNLYRSAEAFAQTWERAEQRAASALP
ncbi:uncharacterized protein SOCE26_064750 [Sorangium cellulosum]|uniref:Ricin B lectin domain-containing protein n=1 Tax=Sorangium cellulosum TaxID=56 RepID=A0A2L0F0D6_SORCE|nr:RICIN domain-containing protein [Sorangium cellulosum]AUX44996.1 uncharacterized protein SOCE26_064750 [Sorangium cellulosum]